MQNLLETTAKLSGLLSRSREAHQREFARANVTREPEHVAQAVSTYSELHRELRELAGGTSPNGSLQNSVTIAADLLACLELGTQSQGEAEVLASGLDALLSSAVAQSLESSRANLREATEQRLPLG